MGKRYCTMPAIPVFRNWFEVKFGDLCQRHDLGYAAGDCKLCHDKVFAGAIASRGHPVLAAFVFIAVNLPWVWWKWFKA